MINFNFIVFIIFLSLGFKFVPGNLRPSDWKAPGTDVVTYTHVGMTSILTN